jgi:hypothetical protein
MLHPQGFYPQGFNPFYPQGLNPQGVYPQGGFNYPQAGVQPGGFYPQGTPGSFYPQSGAGSFANTPVSPSTHPFSRRRRDGNTPRSRRFSSSRRFNSCLPNNWRRSLALPTRAVQLAGCPMAQVRKRPAHGRSTIIWVR